VGKETGARADDRRISGQEVSQAGYIGAGGLPPFPSRNASIEVVRRQTRKRGH